MGRNILIVEDESALGEGLKFMLEKRGHTVRLAGNGREGLSLIGELTPDLLVTDLKMPVMGGLEMMREIQSTGGGFEFPVMVITTSPELMDRESFFGVRVLAKPLGFMEAVVAMEEALSDKEAP